MPHFLVLVLRENLFDAWNEVSHANASKLWLLSVYLQIFVVVIIIVFGGSVFFVIGMFIILVFF